MSLDLLSSEQAVNLQIDSFVLSISSFIHQVSSDLLMTAPSAPLTSFIVDLKEPFIIASISDLTCAVDPLDFILASPSPHSMATMDSERFYEVYPDVPPADIAPRPLAHGAEAVRCILHTRSLSAHNTSRSWNTSMAKSYVPRTPRDRSHSLTFLSVGHPSSSQSSSYE